MTFRFLVSMALLVPMLGTSANAALLDASYSGKVEVQNPIGFQETSLLQATGTVSELGATLTIGSSPTPYIQTFSPADAGGNVYIVNGAVHYLYSVTGPGTDPVDIIAHVVMATSQVQALVSATVGIGAYKSGFTYGLGAPSGETGSFSFDQRISLIVIPGEWYDVWLGAGSEGGATSTYVDPYFYIDPAFDAAHPGYSFSFSPGVSNDVASAVPEPATWAMLLLGFAGIGFTTYRRKLKPALLAAR